VNQRKKEREHLDVEWPPLPHVDTTISSGRIEFLALKHVLNEKRPFAALESKVPGYLQPKTKSHRVMAKQYRIDGAMARAHRATYQAFFKVTGSV
jgi:hypothetical protein